MIDDTLEPASLLDGASEVNSSTKDQLVERRRPGRPTKEAARMPVRVEILVCIFHLFIFHFFIMILYYSLDLLRVVRPLTLIGPLRLSLYHTQDRTKSVWMLVLHLRLCRSRYCLQHQLHHPNSSFYLNQTRLSPFHLVKTTTKTIYIPLSTVMASMTMQMILCQCLALSKMMVHRYQRVEIHHLLMWCKLFLYSLIMLNHVLRELVTKGRAGSMKSSSRSGCRIRTLSFCYSFQIWRHPSSTTLASYIGTRYFF